MAAARSRVQNPVGSAQWILDEEQHANEFVQQEVDEFAFSARNEVEWLNEHMAGIFSRSQFDYAGVFKTPGKLRAKTPRTARTQNGQKRAPLADIFSANIQSPTHNTPQEKRTKQLPKVHSLADKENNHAPRSSQVFSQHLRKINDDSGYHGMTEDEYEPEDATIKKDNHTQSDGKPALDSQQQTQEAAPAVQERRSDTVESFASANSLPHQTCHQQSVPTKLDEPEKTADQEGHDADQARVVSSASHATDVSHQYSVSAETADGLQEAIEQIQTASPDRMATTDDAQPKSPSFDPDPEPSVVRNKNSTNFASFPPREPLTLKKILRDSALQTHSQGFDKRPTSVNGTTWGASISVGTDSAANLDDKLDFHKIRTENHLHDDPSLPKDAEDETITRLQGKTSTQRLHERITMLGKLSMARPSKSIPAAAPFSTKSLKHASKASGDAKDNDEPSAPAQDADDDWIEPMEMSKPANEKKEKDSESIDDQQPGPPSKPEMTSHPDLKAIRQSDDVTAESQASKWGADGPISASKAKFNSFLKSARGIFASSAAASASAKMEALPSGTSKENIEQSITTAVPEEQPRLSRIEVPKSSQPQSVRPTRHDRIEPAHAPDQVDGINQDLHPADQTEQAEERLNVGNEENKNRYEDEQAVAPVEEELHHPGPNMEDSSQSTVQQENTLQGGIHQSQSQGSKLGEARRPPKPKAETSKSRPAMVSIRVPSRTIGQAGSHKPGSNAPAQDPTPAPASTTRPPGPVKKGSNSSLRTVSTQNSKSTTGPTFSRPKALEAAARKKEQDEREAQRKAEYKRQMEQKRTAKFEEERRQAQEQRAAEQQRADEAKAAAQKHAAEQRKAEWHRKPEQHQLNKSRPHTPKADEMQIDSDEHPDHALDDAPELPPRPMSQQNSMSMSQSSRHPPPVNPAKPKKRYFQPEVDNEGPRFASNHQNNRPGSQQPPSPKRRRTSQEPGWQPASKPTTMGPPIRMSGMRKEMPQKFHTVQSHQGMGPQSGSSMIRSMAPSSSVSQHSQQQSQQSQPKTPHMNDLAKFSHGRVPFAGESSNNAAPFQSQSQAQPMAHQHHYHQHSQPSTSNPTTNKTPVSTTKPTTQPSPAPSYPDGDKISLPEINTDDSSSDSDDCDGFVAPDWADSPALREALSSQQLIDPAKVFGPIAPLAMEEVFKGGSKDRKEKFRARTSSANWTGADRLTLEERRRDFEARERLVKEGGWTLGSGT